MFLPMPWLAARTLAALAPFLVVASALAPAARADVDVAAAPRRMEVPLDRVTGSVTVIEGAEIERRGWRTLADALREVPGLQIVRSGGPGAQTSIFTRGTESDHTLILLDGMEVSDPSTPGNTFEPSHLMTTEIERIEVLRGPQSTLYGSNAIGGVINVITRRGEGSPSVFGMLEAGGLGTQQQVVGTRGSSERVDWTLSYTNLHTRGTSALGAPFRASERDAYDNRTLAARADLVVTDGVDLRVFARFVDTDLDTDPGSEDRNAASDSRQLLLRAETELAYLAGDLRARLGTTYVDHDRRDRNRADALSPTSTIDTSDGRRLGVDAQLDWHRGDSQIFSIGAVTERESIDSLSAGLFAGGSSQGNNHAAARTSAVFGQAQVSLANQLHGTLNLRLDHHDEFGSEPGYRAGLAWLPPGTGTKLHASIGTGFKAPSLTDLYGFSLFTFFGFPSAFVGNPDLEPERSRGFEVGATQRLLGERAELGVTYFQNEIRGLIESNASFTSLRNVSRARTRGFESFVRLRIAERLRAQVDHTYLSAENEAGNDLLRRPTHRGNATLEFRPTDRATLGLGATYTGRRRDVHALDFSRISLGGYTTARVDARYELTPRLRLHARIENLFDKQYANPHGFESPPFAGFFAVSGSF